MRMKGNRMKKLINQYIHRMVKACDNGSYLSDEGLVAGDLVLAGDVVIGGQLTGNLKVKGHATLLDTALIHGCIYSQSLQVSGHVVGDILSEDVKLMPDAVVMGSIRTSCLAIEEGAKFNGLCRVGAWPVPEKVDDLFTFEVPYVDSQVELTT